MFENDLITIVLKRRYSCRNLDCFCSPFAEYPAVEKNHFHINVPFLTAFEILLLCTFYAKKTGFKTVNFNSLNSTVVLCKIENFYYVSS